MPNHRHPITLDAFVALLREVGTIDGVQARTGMGNDAAYRLLAEAKAAGYALPERPTGRPRVAISDDALETALAQAPTQEAAAALLGVSHPTLKRRLRERRALAVG